METIENIIDFDKSIKETLNKYRLNNNTENIIELSKSYLLYGEIPIELLRILDKINNKVKIYCSLLDFKIEGHSKSIAENIYDTQKDYSVITEYKDRNFLTVRCDSLIERNLEISQDIFTGEIHYGVPDNGEIYNAFIDYINKDILENNATKLIIKKPLTTCVLSEYINGIKVGSTRLKIRLIYQLKKH